MELTASAVNKLFMHCLHDEGEPHDGPVMVEGLVNTVGFHAGRLRASEDAIKSLLAQLDPIFLKGYLFANLCLRADGVQWTGLHLDMEQLVMLGIGTKHAYFPLKREFWDVLPGGLPYVVVQL